MFVKENHQLRDYNTFHLDVTARKFIEVFSEEELLDACKTNQKDGFLVLGGGSNVLFRDNIGTCLKISIPGIKIIDEDDEFSYINAGAGVIWNDLVNFSVERNLGGIENLVMIPGTVGAAPIQNIGAYGQELKDSFYSLNLIFNNTCKGEVFTKEECRFGYRSSIFKNELKNKCIISSVTLKLNKNPLPDISYSAVKALIDKSGRKNYTIKDISRVISEIRISKLPDPQFLGNAGSFFKNPEVDIDTYENLKMSYPTIPGFRTSEGKVKIAAGWLIEQTGWKGKREGDVGSHKDQALVIVNYGNATGNEIVVFAGKVKKSVKEIFGIDLEEEVNII